MIIANRRGALVEKIARVIAKGEYGENVDDVWENYREEASAAIDIALEEAARMAETLSWMADVEWWLSSTKKEVSARSAQEIASTIRALIQEKQP